MAEKYEPVKTSVPPQIKQWIIDEADFLGVSEAAFTRLLIVTAYMRHVEEYPNRPYRRKSPPNTGDTSV